MSAGRGLACGTGRIDNAGMPQSLPRVLVLLVPVLSALGCATTPEQRADRLSLESTRLLDDAERQLRALKVEEAERTLAWAEERLVTPELELHPESSLLQQRHAELKAGLQAASMERAARELALEVGRQQQALERARTRMLEAVHAAEPLEAGRSPLGAIRKEVEALLRQVEAGRPLEAKSEAYAVDAAHAARSAERSLVRAQLLERRAEFIEGPLGAWMRAGEREALARDATLLVARREALAAARMALTECEEKGRALLESAPQLEAEHVTVKDTAGAVVAHCTRSSPRIAKLLVGVEKKVAAAERKAAAAEKKAARKAQAEERRKKRQGGRR